MSLDIFFSKENRIFKDCLIFCEFYIFQKLLLAVRIGDWLIGTRLLVHIFQLMAIYYGPSNSINPILCTASPA